jgi:hypothetical protein
MRTKSIIYSSIIFLALATSMSSCQYKDFDEYDGMVPVKVIVDYSHSDCKVTPAMSRVVFYPTMGQGNPFMYDIRDSAIVNLPTGQLQAFAFNNTSEINRTRGMADMSASPVIYTDKADYRGIYPKDSLDNTIYFDYPDVTYTAWQTVSVSGNEQVTSADDNRIVLRMHRVTRQVNIEVRGIRNASFVNSLRMSLSGIQREYSPVSSYPHTYVSLVADGTVYTKDPDRDNRSVFDDKTVIDTLRSTMNIFGIGSQRHILNIFLIGSSWHKTLSFDVTDQVEQQAEGMAPVLIIVNTDHDVKDDVPANSQFDIHGSDWEDKDIPIYM